MLSDWVWRFLGVFSLLYLGNKENPFWFSDIFCIVIHNSPWPIIKNPPNSWITMNFVHPRTLQPNQSNRTGNLPNLATLSLKLLLYKIDKFGRTHTRQCILYPITFESIFKIYSKIHFLPVIMGGPRPDHYATHGSQIPGRHKCAHIILKMFTEICETLKLEFKSNPFNNTAS